jgi:tetratricopeptide (TPR) repeat protein
MNIFQNKTSRALIITMCALVLFSVVISHYYYKETNASVDPRIVEARKLYEKYNLYAQKNEFQSIFPLMDSIELIYSSVDHYKQSFEVGVLYNNRSAAYLTWALFSDNINQPELDSLINLADSAINISLGIYDQWLQRFEDKDKTEIQAIISDEFLTGLEQYDPELKDKYLSNRINEIQESQSETSRRMSVAYTNQGIIYRHNMQYDSAAILYKKAIDLWDRNLTAENNLNVLLGRPLKKRSFIQKLFPPERD